MRFSMACALTACALSAVTGWPLHLAAERAAPPSTAAQAPTAPPALPLTVEWRASLDASPGRAHAFDRDHAFVSLATTEGPAEIVALSLADGKVAWRRDTADVIALAADGGLVFAATNDRIEALSAADGERAWQVPLDSAASPFLAAVNGWLVVVDQKRIQALRSREGARVWQQPLPGPVVAPMAVGGDGLYLGTADGRVHRLALATGVSVWHAPIPAAPSSLLALDDRLFVGTRGRYFCALNPRDGKTKWRVRLGSDVVGVTAVDDRCAYFLSLDNLVRGVNRSSGTLESRRILSRRALFGPFRAGSLLVVSGMSPTIEAFSLVGLRPAGTYDVGGRDQGGVKLVAPVHVVPETGAAGTLVVGITGEGDVVALRLPAAKAQSSR